MERGVRSSWDASQVSLWIDWILGLPRVIWEIAGNQLQLTELILLLLIRLYQRAKPQFLVLEVCHQFTSEPIIDVGSYRTAFVLV